MSTGDSPTGEHFLGLREYLDRIDGLGELERVSGAHWDREMSTISDLTCKGPRDPPPALLFDEIPGYPEGYRTLYAFTNSINRFAVTVGMDPVYDDDVSFVAAYREHADAIHAGDPIPPEFVDPADAPLFENSHHGDDVDVLEFPVPLHHDRDGGRYVGTANCVVTDHPETGTINIGTYRQQVFDESTTGMAIGLGKDGRVNLDAYFERDEPAPVAAVCGQDPTLWTFSTVKIQTDSPFGEYATTGGLKGRPVPVVEAPETGLPVPATGEIVLEGYVHPGRTRMEGPFGEWTGYYGGPAMERPVLDVAAVHHREDPILTCAVPAKPPYDYSYHKSLSRSANLWDEIESAGVPAVQGVWRTEAGGSWMFDVVSIEQQYAGHARQAGYVAAQTNAGAYVGRWTVVVDEDIDPADLDEVLWAMSSRCDPATDVEFIERSMSSPLDPLVPDDAEAYHNTRAVVDATVPYERREAFPRVAQPDPAYAEQVRDEWRHVVEGPE